MSGLKFEYSIREIEQRTEDDKRKIKLYLLSRRQGDKEIKKLLTKINEYNLFAEFNSNPTFFDIEREVLEKNVKVLKLGDVVLEENCCEKLMTNNVLLVFMKDPSINGMLSTMYIPNRYKYVTSQTDITEEVKNELSAIVLEHQNKIFGIDDIMDCIQQDMNDDKSIKAGEDIVDEIVRGYEQMSEVKQVGIQNENKGDDITTDIIDVERISELDEQIENIRRKKYNELEDDTGISWNGNKLLHYLSKAHITWALKLTHIKRRVYLTRGNIEWEKEMIVQGRSRFIQSVSGCEIINMSETLENYIQELSDTKCAIMLSDYVIKSGYIDILNFGIDRKALYIEIK
jgi:hypothetical protein